MRDIHRNIPGCLIIPVDDIQIASVRLLDLLILRDLMLFRHNGL
jgi:hypothetical protein